MYTRPNVITLADLVAQPRKLVNAIADALKSNPNVFRAAGLVIDDAVLNEVSNATGIKTDVISWKAIDSAESNVSNDDSTNHATPSKFGTRLWTTVRTHRNKGYSEMDLVAEIVNGDPLTDIAAKVTTFWQLDEYKSMLAILNGLIAADTAGDKSLTYDASTKAFTPETVVFGAQSLGDTKDSITTMIVHSQVHAAMTLGEFNGAYRPASQTNLSFDTYAGKKLIVTDDVPTAVVGGKTIYTSIFTGDNLFKAGRGAAKTPIEYERDARFRTC